MIKRFKRWLKFTFSRQTRNRSRSQREAWARKKLAKAANDLAASQQELPAEDHQALNAHYWELIGGDNTAAQGGELSQAGPATTATRKDGPASAVPNNTKEAV